MNRPSSKGFTLVELLVVVAIIAMLTQLTLPHFQSMIEKARLSEVVLQIDAARTVARSAVQNGDKRLLTMNSGLNLAAPLVADAQQYGFSSGFNYPGLRFFAQPSNRPRGHFPAGVDRIDLQIVGTSPQAKLSVTRLSEILPEEDQTWAVPGMILLVNLAMDNQ